MISSSTNRLVVAALFCLCIAAIGVGGCGRAAEQQKIFKQIRAKSGKIELHGFGPEITFSDVKITDDDLACVTPLKHVHRLILEFVPITDEGLKHILALDLLENIELKQTKITKEGIKKLEEKFPKLIVTER
jgi:hypothetical protein